jgi:hypothetical protein
MVTAQCRVTNSQRLLGTQKGAQHRKARADPTTSSASCTARITEGVLRHYIVAEVKKRGVWSAFVDRFEASEETSALPRETASWR